MSLHGPVHFRGFKILRALRTDRRTLICRCEYASKNSDRDRDRDRDKEAETKTEWQRNSDPQIDREKR